MLTTEAYLRADTFIIILLTLLNCQRSFMTQRYLSPVKDVQIEQLAFSNDHRPCVCFVIGKRACHVIQTRASRENSELRRCFYRVK